MMKNKGITLISLIITIVILIILAGVTINLVLGKNGIVNKAITAKEQYEIAKIQEKLDLKISNLSIEILEKEDRKIELNDIYKFNGDKDKTLIESIPNVSNALYVTIDGYTFIIDENMKSNLTNTKGKANLIYEIVSQNGDNLNIKIKIESNKKIEEVLYTELSNVQITYNESKTYAEIVCDAEQNKAYKIKVKIDGKEQEYIFTPSTNSKPIIEASNSYAYPCLTSSRVELNQYVTITYDENLENYYSLDNGNTWQLYTNPIPLKTNATIKAKSISRTENIVTQEVTQDIQFKLANDAIGSAAYDGNWGSYYECPNGVYFAYMDIDSSVRGKTIKVQTGCIGSNFMSFVLENGEEEIFLQGNNIVVTTHQVPENAVKIKMHDNAVNACFFYEIEVVD